MSPTASAGASAPQITEADHCVRRARAPGPRPWPPPRACRTGAVRYQHEPSPGALGPPRPVHRPVAGFRPPLQAGAAGRQNSARLRGHQQHASRFRSTRWRETTPPRAAAPFRPGAGSNPSSPRGLLVRHPHLLARHPDGVERHARRHARHPRPARASRPPRHRPPRAGCATAAPADP